jgi:hypothetical protein
VNTNFEDIKLQKVFRICEIWGCRGCVYEDKFFWYVRPYSSYVTSKILVQQALPKLRHSSARLQIPFMEGHKLSLQIILSGFNKYLLVNANDR